MSFIPSLQKETILASFDKEIERSKAEEFLSLKNSFLDENKLLDFLQKSLVLSKDKISGTKGIQSFGPDLLKAQKILEERNELICFQRSTNPCWAFFLSLVAPIIGWFARLFSPLVIVIVLLGASIEQYSGYCCPLETWKSIKETTFDSCAQWKFWFELLTYDLFTFVANLIKIVREDTQRPFFSLGLWTVYLRRKWKKTASSEISSETPKKEGGVALSFRRCLKIFPFCSFKFSSRLPPMRRVPTSLATFTTLNDLYWFWAPIIIFCFVVFFVAASMGGVRSYNVNPPPDQLDRSSYLCTPQTKPYNLLPGILGELGFQDFFWGVVLVVSLFYLLLGAYSFANANAFRPIQDTAAGYKSILSCPKAAQYMVSYRWGNDVGALLARTLALHLPDTWLDMKYLRSGDYVSEQTFISALRAQTLVLIIDNIYFSRHSCMSELASVVFRVKEKGFRTLAYIQQFNFVSQTESVENKESEAVPKETLNTLIRLGVECFNSVDELLFALQPHSHSKEDSSHEWWKEFGETLEDSQLVVEGELCKEPYNTDRVISSPLSVPNYEQLMSICFTPTIRARSWVLQDNGKKPPNAIWFPSLGLIYFYLFIIVSIGILVFTTTEFIRFRANFSTPGLLQRAFCTFQLPDWTRFFLNIPAGIIIGWSRLGPYNGGLPPAQVDFPWYPYAAQMGVLLFSYVVLIVLLVDRFFRLVFLHWHSSCSYDQCLHPLYVVANYNPLRPLNNNNETVIEWPQTNDASNKVVVGNPLVLMKSLPSSSPSDLSPFKIGFALASDFKDTDFLRVLRNTIKLLSHISPSLVPTVNIEFDLLVLVMTSEKQENTLDCICGSGTFEQASKKHHTARYIIVRPQGESDYLHLEFRVRDPQKDKRVIKDDISRLLLSTISSKVPGAFVSKEPRVKVPHNFSFFFN